MKKFQLAALVLIAGLTGSVVAGAVCRNGEPTCGCKSKCLCQPKCLCTHNDGGTGGKPQNKE